MLGLTAIEIAAICRRDKRSIQRVAISQNWRKEISIGIGGRAFIYYFLSLPAMIKIQILASIYQKDGMIEMLSCFNVSEGIQRMTPDNVYHIEPLALDPQQPWFADHCLSRPIPTQDQNRHFARTALLSLAKLYVAVHRLRKINGYDHFCNQFNNKTLGITPTIYRCIYSVSRISLLRWEKTHIDSAMFYTPQPAPMAGLQQDKPNLSVAQQHGLQTQLNDFLDQEFGLDEEGFIQLLDHMAASDQQQLVTVLTKLRARRG